MRLMTRPALCTSPCLMALGQQHPAHAHFIRCTPECEKFGKLHLSDFVALAGSSWRTTTRPTLNLLLIFGASV